MFISWSFDSKLVYSPVGSPMCFFRGLVRCSMLHQEEAHGSCVSFERLWAVGSAVCFFRALVSRWINTLSRPLRKPHDPIYSPPLRHVRHSVCTHLVYKAFRFPIIQSYGAFDMQALRSHRRAVWWGNRVFCSIYKSSSASTVYKAFGFPSYSPTVHLIQSIRIPLI